MVDYLKPVQRLDLYTLRIADLVGCLVRLSTRALLPDRPSTGCRLRKSGSMEQNLYLDLSLTLVHWAVRSLWFDLAYKLRLVAVAIGR